MSTLSPERADDDDRKRWWVFTVLCLGYLMMVLDGTIVNVALPSIGTDLAFSESSLVWIVDAYLLTFASFLLLGGRLGDLFGQRQVFLVGMALFTVASLACGLARTRELLIAARAVQGIGSAIVSAVTLSLTMILFPKVPDCVRAIGVYAFVGIGGESAGLLFGGMLTSALSWRWIFLVNIPIGIMVYGFARACLPKSRSAIGVGYLDISGAVTGPTALMFVTYAIVNGGQSSWSSVRTLTSFAAASAVLILFVSIEAKARTPIVPLGLLRRHNLAVANIAGVFWSAALFVWYFISSLYLQLVLGYTPLQSCLAFLPASAITAMLSWGPFVKVVIRFGIKPPLVIGLLVAAAGLEFFARSRIHGNLALDVLPGMIFLGVGGGMVSTPLLLAAMADVAPSESGVGSGVIGTSSVIGGALGLSILTGVATARTNQLLTLGVALPVALTSGYHVAFSIAGIFAIVGAFAAALLRTDLLTPVLATSRASAR